MNARSTRESPTEAALAAVDEIARRGLGWAAPMRFTLAHSQAEREMAYRLRYQAVIERGWHQPAEFPGGLEQDAHDEHAIQLLGWDNGTAITTARLVLPQPGFRLPTEEAFDITIEPRGRVVDAGRYVVARAYSSIEHRVLAGLMAHSWLTVRAHGFDNVCSAFASGPSLRLYRRMGFQMTVLAPSRHTWGEMRYPIRWDVVSSSATLGERWRNLDPV